MKCACLQVTVDDAGNGAVAATQVKSLLQTTTTTTTTTTTHSEQLSLLAAGREKLKQKRERKAARTLVSVWSVSRYGVQGTARTLAIVTGTFVVCWLPFFIVALVQPFYAISEAYPATLASSVIMWLGYVNSLLNPAADGADDVTRPITSSVRPWGDVTAGGCALVSSTRSSTPCSTRTSGRRSARCCSRAACAIAARPRCTDADRSAVL